MHSTEHLGPRKIIGFLDGNVFITETVLLALIVAVIMVVLALLSTRKLEKEPKGVQLVVELIVEGMYKLTGTMMDKRNAEIYAPFVGTLFLFLIFTNATGMFGVRPVTADVNTAFALSTITFLVIQGSSIRNRGILGHIKHYGEPYPFMFPIMVIKDLSLPISLAFRLFGNITGGMIIMAFVFKALHSATDGVGITIPFLQFLIPLPLNLFFDIFEPILQGFIFTTLTMAFLAMSLTTHDDH